MQTTPKVSDLLRNVYPLGGDGSFENPSVGVSHLDPNLCPHPTKGTCKLCDKPLEGPLWRNCDQRHEDGRWLFRGWLPINTCDECAKYSKDSVGSRGEADWLMRCPAEFKEVWKPELGNGEARARAMEFDPALRKGLVLHGPSGAGKTRIAWQIARKVAESGRQWLWVDSLDYVDCVPKEALFIDVLFLDDLGNEHLGQMAETRLLKLLKVRTERHLPFVLTTQHQGDSLSKRFREGASAQAVIRRLREFCDSIHVRARA